MVSMPGIEDMVENTWESCVEELVSQSSLNIERCLTDNGCSSSTGKILVNLLVLVKILSALQKSMLQQSKLVPTRAGNH